MKQPVMIVDDDPSIRETVSILLGLHGYQVIPAPTGRECLDRLRAGFQGVILMDIMMPELDGWATIRAIAAAQLGKHTLICMLTAKAEPGDEGDGLQEHVFDYLPKPFNGNNLIQFVDNAASYLAA